LVVWRPTYGHDMASYDLPTPHTLAFSPVHGKLGPTISEDHHTVPC
jgi:hypothetical protein